MTHLLIFTINENVKILFMDTFRLLLMWVEILFKLI